MPVERDFMRRGGPQAPEAAQFRSGPLPFPGSAIIGEEENPVEASLRRAQKRRGPDRGFLLAKTQNRLRRGVTLQAGASGVGQIVATGNIKVNGPVTLLPQIPQAAPLIAAGNISISAPAKGTCPQLSTPRLALQRSVHRRADLNGDGAVNVADVQQSIDEALGVAPPTANLNGDRTVNVSDVQVVINEALIAGCSQ